MEEKSLGLFLFLPWSRQPSYSALLQIRQEKQASCSCYHSSTRRPGTFRAPSFQRIPFCYLIQSSFVRLKSRSNYFTWSWQGAPDHCTQDPSRLFHLQSQGFRIRQRRFPGIISLATCILLLQLNITLNLSPSILSFKLNTRPCFAKYSRNSSLDGAGSWGNPFWSCSSVYGTIMLLSLYYRVNRSSIGSLQKLFKSHLLRICLVGFLVLFGLFLWQFAKFGLVLIHFITSLRLLCRLDKQIQIAIHQCLESLDRWELF